MKNFGQAWLIAKRELIDQLRDWRILLPMIVLTLFFPYLMNVAAKASLNYLNQFGANLIAERLLPFLILVVGYFPVTVSLVVALESFVGEKERGTIEPLLTSPIADEHLYLGKLMTGTLVPLTVSYVGIALYLGGLTWQGIKWPEWGFISQTLALTAVQTVLMVSAAMVVSTQSTTVRAANLLASFIVIPVALLIQGESALMFWGTNDILWLAVLAVAIMSGLIIRLGIVHFKRENLLGREIDVLNLGWVWRTFLTALAGSSTRPSALTRYLRTLFKPRPGEEREKSSFLAALLADAQGFLDWYRCEIPATLRRLAPSFWITAGLGLVAALFAFIYVDNHLSGVSLSEADLDRAIKNIRSMLLDNSGTGISASFLFLNNLRAELVMLVLGVFSFGVLALLALVANFALIGGILGAVQIANFPPLLVLVAGILPHGIFELTSVILACSTVLSMGLRLVTPETGRSIGETYLLTLADVVKILLAVCLPLLVLAALIEANLTPRLLLAALGQPLEIMP